MIEFPITLTSGGSVCLPGHAFALALGYTKNRGVYCLAISATGEWEGLTIRAFWHVPDGKDPVSSLVADGYVAVPASVTAQPGNGCITFEGSDGTKTVTSADLRYRVSANSGTADGTMPEPGTPAWQQLVDAVHTIATDAEQAKTDAQTAAQQAGRALSDTITAKEDALKAIGDKQTSATTAVESAQGKALDAVTDAQGTATQAVGTVQANAIQQMESTKTDALKAIGDKQTAATQAVDTARDKAIQQVEASTEAAQTAASEAATSAGNADQSAQEAADSLQELKDGIANGNFKGEPGNDGKSPVVTVTDIENGHRVSITDKDGTKTIDVLNGQAGKDGTQIDDATVGLDAWSSKHIVDMLCPPLEETGNPVQCYPVAGYPLGCKVSWEPTQKGSGEPYPAGGGKNKIPYPTNSYSYPQTRNGLTVTSNADGSYTVNGTATANSYFSICNLVNLGIEDFGAFALSGCPKGGATNIYYLALYDGAKWTSDTGAGNTGTIGTIATGARIEITIAAGYTANNLVFWPQLEKGITSTAYAPYENIRPIKGRDSVTVERCGETLLDFSDLIPDSVSRDGLTIKKENGVITVLGEKSSSKWTDIFRISTVTSVFPAGTYVWGSGVSIQTNTVGNVHTSPHTFDTPFYIHGIYAATNVAGKYNRSYLPIFSVGTTPLTAYSPYTGQTSTLTLPTTIYGGTVDAVSGSGEKAWNEITLIDTYSWYASTNQYRTFYCVNIKNITRTAVENSGYAKNWKCTHFKSEAYSYAQSGNLDNTVSFHSDRETLVICFPGTIDELKSYLAAQYAAGTPVQIAYKLAEPIPFTATGPQPIPALSGVNTVITDADSVAVTGRADPIKRITDLEDAVASMT